MRGQELLDKMELIDPVYIEAAEGAPERGAGKVKIFRKLKYIRWGVVAACLCIVLGATTVLAVTGLGTKLLSVFRFREETGYELSADIVKFPAAELKGEIREVPALIRQQFETYKPYTNWAPSSWEKTFETRDEAYDYVGFDKLKRLPWDAEEKETTLHVRGKKEGDIIYVSVETWYAEGGIRMQFFSHVVTENDEGEFTFQTATTENVGFTESFHTTQSGKTLHIIDMTAMESGFLGKDGFLVVDGVLYNLHIAYRQKDAGRAEELLKQWADLF